MTDMLQYIILALQIGFSGFAFVMAYLSFRLMRQEMTRETARKPVFDHVRWYMKWSLALASLVALITIAEVILDKLLTDHAEAAIDCDEGLARLTAISHLPNTDVAALRTAISMHTAACQSLVDSLTRPQATVSIEQ